MTPGDSRDLALKHATDHAESINVPAVKMGTPEWMERLTLNADHSGSTVNAQPVERSSTETRIVDPLTGGEKGSKLARFDLIPPEFQLALAEHYGKGAFKYADRNWEKGYKWGLSLAAHGRHLNSWVLGEPTDPETGSSHLIAAAWHLVALYTFERRGLGTNDVHR